MTEKKKCGQCANLAMSEWSKVLGACMMRRVGMDGFMPRHIGDRACLLYREKEAQDGRG